MSKNNISVIGLSYGDPDLPGTWSNNPYFLFQNLKELELLDFAWGIYPGKILNAFGKLLAGIHYSTIKNSEIAHLTTRLYHSQWMNNKFRKMLGKKKFNESDYKVIISTSSFINFCGLNYPIFLYGDQTSYQMYHENPGVKDKISNRIFEKIIDFEKKQADKCSGIFCFSQWMKDSLVKDYLLNGEKISVVGHGYCLPEIKDFNKNEFEKPFIFFVSTNWERKGGDIVLESYQLVKEKIPEVQLHIAGRAPDFILNSGDKNIVFHGFLNKNNPIEFEKLIRLYKEAAVFILPSVYDPMPNITLEANYLKTPVIASNVCGISEQIIDGKTGFVIKKPDAEKYAEKLLFLLESNETRNNMGNEGRQFVENQFSWNSTINDMITYISNNNIR